MTSQKDYEDLREQRSEIDAVDDRRCIEAGEHLRGQRHRWQECPTYHENGSTT